MKYESTKEERFDSIYRSYAVDVYHACLHITKNYDLSQEMTQQAFVNFYDKMDGVKEECVKAYIINSAKNLIYNYYRKTKREMPNEEGEEMDEDAPLQEPVIDSVEEQYLQNERRLEREEFVREMLAELKESHLGWYQILYKMFYEDKNHDKIAEELGITKEVLYSRLRRAKVWIRKKYGREFETIIEDWKWK